jgi:hypothetical protein
MQKFIENTFNKYSITTEGVVYSHVNTQGKISESLQKERKQQISIWGYKVVDILFKDTRKKYPVHRLVALHFLPNPDNKPCVNHKDGNKFNNNVSNLEWVSHAENEQHSYKILGKKPNGCKEVIVHTKDGKYIGVFPSVAEACRTTGAQIANAIKNIKGLRTHAAGHIFKYV